MSTLSTKEHFGSGLIKSCTEGIELSNCVPITEQKTAILDNKIVKMYSQKNLNCFYSNIDHDSFQYILGCWSKVPSCTNSIPFPARNKSHTTDLLA